jgi:hypothetical protein
MDNAPHLLIFMDNSHLLIFMDNFERHFFRYDYFQGIPCLYCEKVMEVMWGLKNCMRSLVPQEESELTNEDRLPMSLGLRKFLNLNGFDDVQPEMVSKTSWHAFSIKKCPPI